MSKSKILVQLDADPQPSVFDAVAAIDAGVDHLLRHGGVTVEQVRGLVHGAMFTRSIDDLRNTAIFIGGSDVGQGEALMRAAVESFFGPIRVSVMMDANGANTTAAAAVLAAAEQDDLKGINALVLAATGPVGSRVVRLLARQGGVVRVGSRSEAKAAALCETIRQAVPEAKLQPVAAGNPAQVASALSDVALVVAAGAAGVTLLDAETRKNARSLKTVVDLNAVPPLGVEGIEAGDYARLRDGVHCFGAIGVGGLKMKIHRKAVRRLFESNDQTLDAEEIFALGQTN